MQRASTHQKVKRTLGLTYAGLVIGAVSLVLTTLGVVIVMIDRKALTKLQKSCLGSTR